MVMIFSASYFVFGLYGLFKGEINYDSVVSYLKARLEVDDQNDMDKGLLWGTFFKLIISHIYFMLIQLILLAYTYDVDTHKWPTLFMIMVLTVYFARMVVRRTNLDTKEWAKERLKAIQRFTLRGILFDVASVIYYGYILFILCFA